MVPLAADNALNKSANVDQTEIPEFDCATVDQLGTYGLSGVDAFASAPTNLITAISISPQSMTPASLLIPRRRYRKTFASGYLAYPGITKTQSAALTAEFVQSGGSY